MSLKTPNPMATMSAPPKPIKDPAALLASVIRCADTHYAREDWLAARDFLSLAVQINPDYPRLLGSLGSLQFQLQEYPAACATFFAAVRQTPNDPDLHVQLAMIYIQLKQVDEAKAALQRSLILRPNNPTARRMLGDLDFTAKRYADAAQQYCALMEGNPDGVNLLLHLGKCQYELRDLASARWCFERVIVLEPTNAIAAEALQILATSTSSAPCLSALSQRPIDHAMDAPTVSPAQDLLSHTLAFCDDCLNQQDFSAAWQALCRAVSMAPNRADVLIHRGSLALFLKDTEHALGDFAAALKIDTCCSAAWSGLGRYHLQQGELVEAEAAADRALGIDPTDEDAVQVKAELEAERCKARAHGLRNINSLAAASVLGNNVPNTARDPDSELIKRATLVCPACQERTRFREYPDVYGPIVGRYEGVAATLCICAECGHIFFWPFPDAKVLNHYYNHYYRPISDKEKGYTPAADYGQTAHERRLVHFNRTIALLKKHEPELLDRPLKYHDIGCGYGGFVHLVNTSFPEIEGTGNDTNQAGITEGRRRGNNRISDSNLADVLALKPAATVAGRYDLFTLYHVIEHLADPIGMLRQLSEWLSPNGLVSLTFPNGDYLPARRTSFKEFSWVFYPGHLQYFTLFSISRLLEKLGMKVVLAWGSEYEEQPELLVSSILGFDHQCAGYEELVGFLAKNLLSRELTVVAALDSSKHQGCGFINHRHGRKVFPTNLSPLRSRVRQHADSELDYFKSNSAWSYFSLEIASGIYNAMQYSAQTSRWEGPEQNCVISHDFCHPGSEHGVERRLLFRRSGRFLLSVYGHMNSKAVGVHMIIKLGQQILYDDDVVNLSSNYPGLYPLVELPILAKCDDSLSVLVLPKRGCNTDFCTFQNRIIILDIDRADEKVAPVKAKLQALAPKPLTAAQFVEGDGTAAPTGDSHSGNLVVPATLFRHPALNHTTRIVVLDENGRYQELYGRAFELLGIQPQDGYGKSPEEILEPTPDVIILSREWTVEWRLCAAAARKANIPVIYVVDGSIEWSYLWNNLSWIRPLGTNLQPLIGSDLCVFGQHQARIFSSMGLGSRIHVVGLPRMDAISRERVVKPGAKPRIVVATSRTAGHDVEQQVMVLRALRDLQAWFATRPDIDVVWRIAADLAEDIGVKPDIVGNVSDVLASATALISLPSTCLLEGMHKGIPVAQLEYRSVPLYTATAWEVRCASHIPGVVHELLYPPPSKLAWQDACFADELESGSASGRLADVIRSALGRHDHYAIGGQPIRIHGKLDYRQIYSELSAFAMDDAAVLQYELSAAYSALRQARTDKAQVRRECLEMAEAFAGKSIGQTRVYAFLDQLGNCKARMQPPHMAVEVSCTIDGRVARTLMLHPPGEAIFSVPTGAAGRLTFAVSLNPAVWNNAESGACCFVVMADGQVIFDVTIDQYANPADRRWHWFDLPVPGTPAGAHNVTLSTRGVGGDAFRWALWRNPVFLWDEAEDSECETFLPKAARGANYYVPGRSVP